MPKVIFVIGLCGSGKSWLLDQLKYEHPEAVTFESLIGNNQMGLLRHCLEQGRDCIVEEISFCHSGRRKWIVDFLSQVPKLQIEWKAFENDLEGANWNVIHRTNKGEPERHIKINEGVHRGYELPDEGIKPIPIFRIKPRTTPVN